MKVLKIDNKEIFKELKKIDLNNIKYFATNIGPKNLNGKNASYTGLRISSVIGNTLNLANKIKLVSVVAVGNETMPIIVQKILKKIKNQDFSRLILPKYSNQPNITLKKPIC